MPEFETILLLTTGGLAGAVLTILHSEYKKRKDQVTLSIREGISVFSFADTPYIKGTIETYFEGKSYKNIRIARVEIKNIGKVSVKNPEFIISTSSNAKILEKVAHIQPIISEINQKQVLNSRSEKTDLIYTPDKLEPDDTFYVALVLDDPSQENIEIKVRNIDNVKIAQTKLGEHKTPLVKNLSNLIGFFTLLWLLANIQATFNGKINYYKFYANIFVTALILLYGETISTWIIHTFELAVKKVKRIDLENSSTNHEHMDE